MTGLAVIVLFGSLMVSAVSAETSVQQSSSSSVEQRSSVSGGDAHVEQESTTRTKTNDALVEQRAELNATKAEGEDAQIERDVDRRVVNPNNESISYDVDQQVNEGEHSLETSQGVSQELQDVGNATVEETEQRMESTSAAADTVNGQEAPASAETGTAVDTSSRQQSGTLALFAEAATTIRDTLMDLFTF